MRGNSRKLKVSCWHCVTIQDKLWLVCCQGVVQCVLQRLLSCQQIQLAALECVKQQQAMETLLACLDIVLQNAGHM